MNTKIIKFDLNRKLYEKIVAKQGDTKSRFLLFNLLDGSVPFNLTNRSVRVYGLKKDGTEIFNDLIINNATKGYCTLELTNQMLALSGEVELELMIIEGDKKLTSNIFTLEVRKSINSEKAIVSTNEFTALLNGLASLNEYDNYKNEIKEARGGQTKLKDRLDEFDSHLEQNTNLLEGKRDKSVKLNYSDIEDLNLNNFNEETRAKILGLSEGETNINAVLGEGNVKEINLGDGEVSSLKTYMFEGTLANGITVDYVLNTVTIKANSYICANWRTYVITSEDLTVPIPTTVKGRVHILLYDIDTKVVRLIANNVLPSKREIVICYLYNNSVFGKNASKINCIVEKEEALKNINDIIKEVLSNNSKSSVKVKFIGDSITAGVKATGYGLTETQIGNTGKFVPKQDSLCWANLLGRNIERVYSKSKIIGCNDKRVTNIRAGEINKDKNSILRLSKYYLASVSGTSLLNFEFYGKKIGVYFTKQSGSGIVGIYIDNNKVDEIDLYSATVINSYKFEKIDLTDEKHILTLKYEGKNENSVSSRIYVEGFEIEKTVNCINYGISGINTEFIYNNLSSLIETDDDVVIMQIGTNDRLYKNLDSTRNYLIEIINYIRDNNKQLILCCSLPASETNESNELYCGEMSDVMNVIIEVANIYNIKIINNYNYIKKYCLLNKIDINTLLADGLHPNDEGYYLMYANGCEVLELPII